MEDQTQTCHSQDVLPGGTVLFCIGSLPVYAWAWLETGYGATAVLLVFYFACERSPVHWSRKTEKGYLLLALAIFQLCGEVFAAQKTLDAKQEASEMLQIVMRRILFVYLYQQNARMVRSTPKAIAAMHDSLYCKESGRRQPPYLAIRVAEELEALVDSMLDLSGMNGGASVLLTQPNSVVILLCLFFVVGDFTWCSLHFAENLSYALSIGVHAVMVYAVISVARFSCRLSHLRRQAHSLVDTLLAAQDPDTLQYVLTKVSILNLMEVSAWHTVRLLTCSALEGELLSTASKIMLLVSLQKKGLKCKRAQEEVKRLLLSCEGTELTAVKNTIDSSGSYRNLFKLVYDDLPDGAIRREILRHFSDQARILREEQGGSVGIKVLSDVDDTLYCSGGKFPAGCDTRFPKREVYPGCLTLFRVLDNRCGENKPHCGLVFLSARPHVYKGYAEDQSYKRFRQLHESGRLHSLPTLLAGKLREGLWALLAYPCLGTRAWQPVGDLKRETYTNFEHLYGEYDFVFFGDNGQGDLWAGQHMLRDKRLSRLRNASVHHQQSPTARDPLPMTKGPRLLAVLVHEVMPEERCLAMEAPSCRGPAWPSSLHQQGLLLHRSYVGAALALHLYAPELVSVQQLAQVASDAAVEFDRMRLKYAEWGESWAAAEQDLRADIEAADAVAQAAGLPALDGLTPTRELLTRTRRSSWEVRVRRVFSVTLGEHSPQHRSSSACEFHVEPAAVRLQSVELCPLASTESEGPF